MCRSLKILVCIQLNTDNELYPHPLLGHSNQDRLNEWGVWQILQNAYTVLVGKPKQKRPPGTPRQRWEDNIKMDLKEMGWDYVD
jgi:hypothetical protein